MSTFTPRKKKKKNLSYNVAYMNGISSQMWDEYIQNGITEAVVQCYTIQSHKFKCEQDINASTKRKTLLTCKFNHISTGLCVCNLFKITEVNVLVNVKSNIGRRFGQVEREMESETLNKRIYEMEVERRKSTSRPEWGGGMEKYVSENSTVKHGRGCC